MHEQAVTGLAAHLRVQTCIYGAQLLCNLQGSSPVMCDLDVGTAPQQRNRWQQIQMELSSSLHMWQTHSRRQGICSICSAAACQTCVHVVVQPAAALNHYPLCCQIHTAPRSSLLCSPRLCVMCLGASSPSMLHFSDVAGLRAPASRPYPKPCLQLRHAPSCWLATAR